jgi:hypothetical protein
MSKLIAVEKAFSKWDDNRKKSDGDYAMLSDGRAVTPKDDEWMCISGTIWMKGDKLVITGCPKTEEHNCDAMGCGSLEHIILRAKVYSNGI